jgi:WD40 repeat protein
MPLFKPIQHPEFSSLVISPDGRRLLTYDGSHRPMVHVWDLATGERIGDPVPQPGRIWHAAFNADGKTFVTALGDSTARLWNAETGLQIHEAMHHNHEVAVVAFSPEGKRLLTASQDRTARLWDVETGQAVGQIMFHAREIFHAVFSPDGEIILTAGADGTARLWNAVDGTPRLIQATTGAPLPILFQHRGPVSYAAFSEDGRYIFTASNDRKLRRWSVATGELTGEEMHHENGFSQVSLSSSNVLVASGNRFMLWPVESTTQRTVLSLRHRLGYGDFTPETFAFSLDGSRLLMADHLGSNWWWTLETGAVAPAGFHHPSKSWSINLSRDGERILTAGSDGQARLWAVSDGRLLASFQHRANVHRAIFSPDEKHVATASDDHTAALWSSESFGQAVHSLRHPMAVKDVAFHPDNSLVVTACADGLARVWSVRTGQQLGPVLAHGGALSAVAFSPDGQLIATGGNDKRVKLWNAHSHRPTGVVLETRARITDLAFSPDGRLLAVAAGHGDETVRIWSPHTGELMAPPYSACCDLNALSLVRMAGSWASPDLMFIPQFLRFGRALRETLARRRSLSRR